MPDVLVAATVLSLLFAVLMTVIAAKLLREGRTRTSSRIEALQALAAEPAPTVPVPLAHDLHPVLTNPAGAPTLPRPAAAPSIDLQDTDWDFALHDEPAVPAATLAARPVPRDARTPAFGLQTAHFDVRPAHFDVRPAHFDLRPAHAEPPADRDLFTAPIEPTPSRRWTWVAVVAVVMTLGGGTFYMISSGLISRAIATHEANVTNATALPIELLSLRYATDGGNFVVTGLVQNPATSVSLRGVFAIVYLFDAEGKFIASARASLETGVLSPGGESSFVVRVPAGADVTKYRVSFQHEDGAAVQHVDRRGAMPANTTGDAVQPAPVTPVITARKNG